VATLGTALNVRHIAQLKRVVPKVVLVYDADAGGQGGVDRALELFVSQDVDLAVATLPSGLDPCDFLVKEGPDPFRAVLDSAVNALDYKLTRAFTTERMSGIEGRRQALEEILQVLAKAPEMSGPAAQVKRELIVTRISQQAGVKEETVWQRLREMRQAQKPPASSPPYEGGAEGVAADEPKQAPAIREERELLAVLLAEPTLVTRAREEVQPAEITHPGLQRVLRELYALREAGVLPDVNRIRVMLTDNNRLAEAVLILEGEGQAVPERAVLLEECIEAFRRKRQKPEVSEIQGRLKSVPTGGPPPVELLRRLQEKR